MMALEGPWDPRTNPPGLQAGDVTKRMRSSPASFLVGVATFWVEKAREPPLGVALTWYFSVGLGRFELPTS